MKLVLFSCFIFSFFLHAQSQYPQDYFSSPLEIPIALSGTFAELRSNHFHSGLDIKTQQRVGLKILAAAEGYVSRIKVSFFGYGKALYITHPNGYTTVYAHLQKFAPAIEAYVKKRQYSKESYQLELFPQPEDLVISKGELVAYSGNSGGSLAPHLHFEIRDNQERPLNPMLFGFDVKDTTPPFVSAIYAYPIGEGAHVSHATTKQRLRLIPSQYGDYTTEKINAYGKIGIAIATNDRQDHAPNKNGVYNIQTFLNGTKSYELDFKQFSFDETGHINRLIDYKHYKEKKQYLQKLFNDANPLSIIKPYSNDGYISIKDSTSYVYKIKINDFKNNPSWITLDINGIKNDSLEPPAIPMTPYFISSNQTTELREGSISVNIFKNTFYDDVYLNFEVQGDTLMLHDDIVPLKKNMTLSFDISHYPAPIRDKLYIANLVGRKKYPAYTSTKREGQALTARTKKLGTYTIAMDTVSPTIQPRNFKDKQWLSNYRFLKIRINDSESGISNYRATVNGKWILMEYDYKTKTLTHDFSDGIVSETKNNLKLIVTDNVGNSSTFETLFYRK
ncbi:M23 family metallopeptidase [Aestuariivivens sediminicola]|uniref:M23 family metallopeptidase n=1 Tax=Aestuariivivens sediminicola TaxID=2913560 RepID=UPI001F55D89B|nr:M23 family metallopeptidase [Aestuariivivens sediminicola]